MPRFLERDIEPKEVLFFIRWRGAPTTSELRRWFATGSTSMAYCIGYLYQRRKIIGVGACGGRIYWMIATGERGFPSPKRARADAAGYRTGHPKAVERIREQAAEAHAIDGILRTDEGALVTRMT